MLVKKQEYLIFILLSVCIAGSSIVKKLYETTRCSSSTTSLSCSNYDRCKKTQRCPIGIENYNIVNGTFNFYTSKFMNGKLENALLFNDFEDWHSGTHNWKSASAVQLNDTLFGWNTFSFDLLDPLELYNGTLFFNTTSCTLLGDVMHIGYLTSTFQDPSINVCIFNFQSVYLGKMTNILTRGNRPLVLMSRSSIIIDTLFNITYGNLGGFPGGGVIRTNNLNGPGSNNKRIYIKKIMINYKIIPEIEMISLTVDSDENLDGYFKLKYGNSLTELLPYNIDAEDLRNSIETSFNELGNVLVSENTSFSFNTGHSWLVTFTKLYPSSEQLKIISFLKGADAKAIIYKQQKGAELTGYFKLNMFNVTTGKIPHDISDIGLKGILTDSFKSKISDVVVTKHNSIGLSSYWRKITWKVIFTTQIGNLSPLTPTSSIANETGYIQNLALINQKQVQIFNEKLQTFITIITPSLSGIDVTAIAEDIDCFSISYGGSGGSYSGISSSNNSDLYLLGGSGGAAAGNNINDILPFIMPVRGGSGGGAIYLYSLNDIFIGSNGKLLVNGQDGQNGIQGGGGGSGGTIIISCNGSFTLMGELLAKGGNGGNSQYNLSSIGNSGGGGSGGKIYIMAESINLWRDANLTTSKGISKKDKQSSDGIITIVSRTNLNIKIDPLTGAAGTQKSLVMHGGMSNVFTNDKIHAMANSIGPRFAFKVGVPTRVSYYLKVGMFKNGSISDNKGGILGLLEKLTDKSLIISVGIIDGKFAYSSNQADMPTIPFFDNIEAERWYKVDILIDWAAHTYEIRVNGVLGVTNIAFKAESFEGVILLNKDTLTSWWDEIYVGTNFLSKFSCPFTVGGMLIGIRSIRNESYNDLGPEITYWNKTRHYSHLSERALYLRADNGGLIPFDGPMLTRYSMDIKKKFYSEFRNYPIALTDLFRVFSKQDDSNFIPFNFNNSNEETLYWFSEAVSSEGTDIGCCSTADSGKHWVNEGIMVFAENISLPTNSAEVHCTVTLPKVIVNHHGDYVMWMKIDSLSSNLGLSGVAKSFYANGPFQYIHSLYPSSPLEAPGGLQIHDFHDQTVLVDKERGKAYLIRLYYKSVDYWLPRQVMAPLWETIPKNSSNETDFSLTYHRAYFHTGYDNKNDIYLQQWRMEDVPWNVSCCESGSDQCIYLTDPNGEQSCPEGTIKSILGQSQNQPPIASRFEDPRNIWNNNFVFKSVSSVSSWGEPLFNTYQWNRNYFNALSVNITNYIFQKFANYYTPEQSDSYDQNDSYPPEKTYLFINSSDIEKIDALLGTIGVPVSPEMQSKYDTIDLEVIDQNVDGKITSSEIAYMISQQNSTSTVLYDDLMSDYQRSKMYALENLDADNNTMITYSEFANWVGMNDPDIMFDMFDLDKSGSLDENELGRLMIYLLMPRIDSIFMSLDPDFDGEVYYEQFQNWIQQAPTYIFNIYDDDSSGYLDSTEISNIETDMGPYFSTIENISAILGDNISFSDYKNLLVSSTTLTRQSRDQLKIDNAVHETPPDSLIGPLYVAETRRASYIGINILSEDMTSPSELLKEIEGDFLHENLDFSMGRFSLDLFELNSTEHNITQTPYMKYLSPCDLKQKAWYWNGIYFERRPVSPNIPLYGEQCNNIARTTIGCPPCFQHNPFDSSEIDDFISLYNSSEHCQNNKEMDAYIKSFDQWTPVAERFQQQGIKGVQGYQPNFSPCLNQSQAPPCDIIEADESVIGSKEIYLHWEENKNNRGSSQKIRATPQQKLSIGPTFSERFPDRHRFAFIRTNTEDDSIFQGILLPDQLDDPLLGGGQ